MHRIRRKRWPMTSRLAGLAIGCLLPLLLGGCPEFRNGSVDAFDAATRSVVLGDTTTDDATDAASRGVLNAALDLLFDQFRTSEFN